jgi:hypothetical protein
MQERHAMHEEAMEQANHRPEMFVASPEPQQQQAESLVQQLQARRNASGRSNGCTIRQQIASEAMFNEIDVNGDGVIDRHEFAAAMQTPVDNSLRSQLLHASDRPQAEQHVHHMNLLRQHH